jgi:hypothetical protein
MNIFRSFLCCILALLLFGIGSTYAKAGTVTYGPLTFGSNAPLGEAAFYPQYDVVAGISPGVRGDATNGTPLLLTETVDFTFDIAPGWSITGMNLDLNLDYGFVGENRGPTPPITSWTYLFAQQVTLCDSHDVCSTTKQVTQQGQAPAPSYQQYFDAQVGPDTGVYQSFLYLDNAQVGPNGLGGLDIYLAPAPEPAPLLLCCTGIAGLIYLRSKT